MKKRGGKLLSWALAIALACSALAPFLAQPTPVRAAILSGSVTVTVDTTLRTGRPSQYTVVWNTDRDYSGGFSATIVFPAGTTVPESTVTRTNVTMASALGSTAAAARTATTGALSVGGINVQTVVAVAATRTVTITATTTFDPPPPGASDFAAVAVRFLLAAGVTNPPADTGADLLTVAADPDGAGPGSPEDAVSSADLNYNETEVALAQNTAGSVTEYALVYEVGVLTNAGTTVSIVFPLGSTFPTGPIPREAVTVAANVDTPATAGADRTFQMDEVAALTFTPLAADDLSPLLDVNTRTLTVSIPRAAAPTVAERAIVVRVAAAAGIRNPTLSREGGDFGTYSVTVTTGVEPVTANVALPYLGGITPGYQLVDFVSQSTTSAAEGATVTFTGGGFSPGSSIAIVPCLTTDGCAANQTTSDQPATGTGAVRDDGAFTITARRTAGQPASGARFVTVQDATGRRATTATELGLSAPPAGGAAPGTVAIQLQNIITQLSVAWGYNVAQRSYDFFVPDLSASFNTLSRLVRDQSVVLVTRADVTLTVGGSSFRVPANTPTAIRWPAD